MNIREAIVNDLNTIVKFNMNLAEETESKILNMEKLRKGILKVINGEVQGKYFVCEINNLIVGQMMILYEWSDWRNGEFIWIQSVYVDKEYRKHGVFKMLFNHVKDYCNSREDFIGLRLYVEKNNDRAKKVYSSLGMYKNDYDMYEYLK